MSHPHVYALGSNGSGQLGIGHLEDTSEPTRCIFEPAYPEDCGRGSDSVKMIAAGGNHTLILTESGRVYAAGENVDGRCGFGDGTTKSLIFREVREEVLRDREVTHVAASWEASFFVLDRRIVMACGTGRKGEIGLGNAIPQTVLPRKILELESGYILDIAAAMGHAAVVTSDGKVWGWGSSRKGQLGDELKNAKIQWEPAVIDVGVSGPTALLVGRDFTIVQETAKSIALLGGNKYFGAKDVEDLLKPDGTLGSSSWSSVYAHSSTSSIVECVGRNDRGQKPPENVPGIRAFAAGSEHCIAITLDGHVISWGWGEHGNCGEPVDYKGNVVDRWNILPLPDGNKTKSVAAGCATSFIICAPFD